MFFTTDDYRKILEWLYTHSIKDTDLSPATPLEGQEVLSIVQNGQNVQVQMSALIEQLLTLGVPDFLNVTEQYDAHSLAEAIVAVPSKARRVGQVITFLDVDGNWQLYQFQGKRLNQWSIASVWVDLLVKLSGGFAVDNEDLTSVSRHDSTVVKFKDRYPDDNNFLSRGYMILRKNIIDGKNVLTLIEMDYANTIYEVRYDFDLLGLNVTLPNNCTLEFKGGSINNGTIICNGTLISPEFRGTATLEGTYRFTALKPDNEDLTVDVNSLSLANKSYSPTENSGLGRVYVRKNKTLTELLTSANTIYIILYDHNLDNSTITIPSNSVLKFEGGSINNGAIVCDNTLINPEFNGSATLEGTYRLVLLLADNEDLTLVDNNSTLKLADREYSPADFSGKGYKILRKNIVGGKNILTQAMINQANTVYEIRYDFDLNSLTITIPEGCILRFLGGSLSNGILSGSYTKISLPLYSRIFSEMSFSGNFDISNVIPQWWGAVSDGITDCTSAMREAIRFACFNNSAVNRNITSLILLPNGRYKVSGDCRFTGISFLSRANIKIEGSNSTIVWFPNSVDDCLFYFDGSISSENIRNLTITSNSNFSDGVAGTIFRLHSLIPNIGNAENFYKNVKVVDGYWGSVVTHPKYIFYITGDSHCDLTKVDKCSFENAEIIWYNDNPEAVGWRFTNCNFLTMVENSIFFYATHMLGNLVIRDSHFTALKNYTTFIKMKGEDKISSGEYVAAITSCRFETLKEVTDYIYIVDNDYSRTIIKECEITLASGTGINKYRLSRGAVLVIEDSYLARPEIHLPRYTSVDYVGNITQIGVYLNRVLVIDWLPLKIYDHVNNTSYLASEILANRSIKFRNLKATNVTRISDSSSGYNFTLFCDEADSRIHPAIEEKTILFEYKKKSWSTEFRLPAYSMITLIDVIKNSSGSQSTEVVKLKVCKDSREDTNPYIFDIIPSKYTDNFQLSTVFKGFLGELSDKLFTRYFFEAAYESGEFAYADILLKIHYTQYMNLYDTMCIPKNEEDPTAGYQPFIIYENNGNGITSWSSKYNKMLIKTDNKWTNLDGSDPSLATKGTTTVRELLSLTASNNGFEYYDTDLKRNVFWDGTGWCDSNGFVALANKGTTLERNDLPTVTLDSGLGFYDTTLKKLLYWNGGVWTDANGRSAVPTYGASLARPSGLNSSDVGLQYFDTTTNTLIYWDGTNWQTLAVVRSGETSNLPSNPPIGTSFFCTNKATTEGGTNGIMIYHKGANIWVDAFGRQVVPNPTPELS